MRGEKEKDKPKYIASEEVIERGEKQTNKGVCCRIRFPLQISQRFSLKTVFEHYGAFLLMGPHFMKWV